MADISVKTNMRHLWKFGRGGDFDDPSGQIFSTFPPGLFIDEIGGEEIGWCAKDEGIQASGIIQPIFTTWDFGDGSQTECILLSSLPGLPGSIGSIGLCNSQNRGTTGLSVSGFGNNLTYIYYGTWLCNPSIAYLGNYRYNSIFSQGEGAWALQWAAFYNFNVVDNLRLQGLGPGSTNNFGTNGIARTGYTTSANVQIAIVRDTAGPVLSQYVNGELQDSVTDVDGSYGDQNSSISIGNTVFTPGTAGHMNDQGAVIFVDQVVMYEEALTSAQLLAEYEEWQGAGPPITITSAYEMHSQKFTEI